MDLGGVVAEPAVKRLRRSPQDRERGGQVVGLQVDHGKIPTGAGWIRTASLMMPARRRASWQASLRALDQHEASAIRTGSAWPGSRRMAKATDCTRSMVLAACGEDIT